jgi:hypothetical protein
MTKTENMKNGKILKCQGVEEMAFFTCRENNFGKMDASGIFWNS